MRTLLICLLATACVADADDDGLTNAEEAELGTDPDKTDSDDDGLSDFAEVTVHLTDPLAADTDRDGFADSEEIDAATDPLDALSYTRTDDGRWPDLRAHADIDEATGWALGDRYANLEAMDQYGQPVELEQFYGNVVLVDYSAGWCAPCRRVAAEAEAEYRARSDDGFVVVHMMSEDYSGNEPTEGFLLTWAAASKITFPVVYSPDIELHLDGLAEAGLYEGAIPFMLLLDRRLRIVQAGTGTTAVPDLLAEADALLAE